MGRIDCLPGITGAASLVFAKEEILLAGIPRRDLDNYYAQRVIPLKQQLDDAYMARATFLTDLKIIALSVVEYGWTPMLCFRRSHAGCVR